MISFAFDETTICIPVFGGTCVCLQDSEGVDHYGSLYYLSGCQLWDTTLEKIMFGHTMKKRTEVLEASRIAYYGRANDYSCPPAPDSIEDVKLILKQMMVNHGVISDCATTDNDGSMHGMVHGIIEKTEISVLHYGSQASTDTQSNWNISRWDSHCRLLQTLTSASLFMAARGTKSTEPIAEGNVRNGYITLVGEYLDARSYWRAEVERFSR